jgi:hypothetical protein
MVKMNLSIKKNNDGFVVNFNKDNFSVKYPRNIWNNFPDEMKDFFMDNYLFLKSIHLPLILDANNVKLNTSQPLLKSFFLSMQFMDIPNISDFEGVKPEKYFKRFFNSRFEFANQEVKHPQLNLNEDENSSVLSFSFGKESLLGTAVSKEIGLNPHPVWIEEKGAPVENEFKKQLSEKFNKDIGIVIEHILNETMLLHKFDYLGLPSKIKYSLSHLLTEYTLLLIPFLYNYGAKYLFLGNEKSCSVPYINEDGYRCYPAFDQTVEWTKELNNTIKIIFGNKFNLCSLLEPIHELAIIKILHERYPKFAKYQYSCFPDESVSMKNERWCCNCTKCARMYIFFKALNIDVSKLGFKEDMLSENYTNYFSIFKTGDRRFMYDTSGLGRDEQLLAFYLAFKNGVKGDLIEEFKKRFLDEVKKREDDLIKEFLKVHDSFTIPKKIKQKTLSIYREELG